MKRGRCERRPRLAVALGIAAIYLGGAARAQELHLFGDASQAPGFSLGLETSAVPIVPFAPEPSPSGADVIEPSPPSAPPPRRCVLFQCETLPIAPSKTLFNKGATLWTAAGLVGGFIDGFQNPLRYGFQPFHFTDEGFFGRSTYAGGADKASHFIVSANVAGLLYDAYTLNGLTPDQSFALSLMTMVLSGAFVEIGDAVTPYGFSAQDLTADTLGALAGALVQRGHVEDLIGFQIGKIPTTIPPGGLEGHGEGLGFDYSNEMYTMNLKLAGLFDRLHTQPGFGRYFLVSFAFLTKGFGYEPPIPSRYQEVGFEVGLNFPELLKTAGISDETWWGDLLLRAFRFFRIPYTQIGAYYNLKNNKWYGPGAPYHYY